VTNPGFFELYGFFPGSFVGNPALEPEKSEGWDLGVEWRAGNGRLRADLTWFQSDLTDEIVTVFDAVTFASTAVNLAGRSERRGLEAMLSAFVSPRWELAASYAWVDSAQPDGLAEIRRPRHSGTVSSTWQTPGDRGRLTLDVHYNGEQPDSEFVFATPESRVDLDPFWLVDLAASYDLTARWQLTGRVRNLLDEDYEEIFSYRAPGRAFYLGLRYRTGP
jgi:vitamin B12 transporter